jgi:hypothetical protein
MRDLTDGEFRALSYVAKVGQSMAEGVYWKRHQAHADKLLAKGLIETGDLLGIPLYKLTNEGRKVIGAVE